MFRTVELSIARVGHLHELHEPHALHGHRHPLERVCTSDTIYLPYRGLLVCHAGADEVVGDANQVLFLRDGERYRVSAPVAGGSSALKIAPRPGIADEIAHAVAEADRRPFRRTRAACAHVQLLRARLLHRLARSVTGDACELEALAFELLCSVLARSHQQERTIGAKTARLMRRAKEFLAAELANPVRLDDVGRAVGASPVYLTELFRRIEGLSLHQYLTRLRLARALVELPHTDDLTALGLELGFSSHSHFSAVFRRVFGCTPSQCRTQLREHARRPARAAAMHVLGGVVARRAMPPIFAAVAHDSE